MHGDKDNFLHIYAHRKKCSSSEYRTRNPAVTSPMRFRYTNFVCEINFLFYSKRKVCRRKDVLTFARVTNVKTKKYVNHKMGDTTKITN